MKLVTYIYGIALLALQRVDAAQPNDDEAKAICGKLGVMDTTGMSEDAASKTRLCAEHPLGHLDPSDDLSKRRCWNGKPVGCSRGYCWHTCGGGGQWCWAAEGDGTGPWITCKNDSQCSSIMACGAGNCKRCGCTC
ncbi:hypothetical protein ISF_09422 [Cordyceps fumosorosea ARSEF 2679]|uniref:IDI-2 n=1 Tax=Cordyceps fumosorosea (strain ARSEF 2679) TaxID=1081104 RepID=A0A167J2D4_CORFA|nr:hypothetical protein ISF_09422 [Cordyceps fumosorosea ARSEF 2679]OAA49719.1 hypothetical protein ISF_09422 [Cordyceps fumosorosea ARSEF 2679]